MRTTALAARQPAGVLYLPSRLEALEVTMDTTSESLGGRGE